MSREEPVCPQAPTGLRSPGERPAAFCVLTTTGVDPATGELLGLAAWRAAAGRDEAGELDLPCRAARRSAAGDLDADLAHAPEARVAWAELLAFSGARPLVVERAEEFLAWARHLHDPRRPLPPVLGLDELRALLASGTPAPAAPDPDAVRAGLEALRARHARDDEPVRRLTRLAWEGARRRLAAVEPEASERLRLALELVAGPEALEELAPGAELDELALLLDEAEPGWTRRARVDGDRQPLPPHRDEPLPFADADHELLEAVFRVHLPAEFAGPGGAPSYRASQHQVALELARTFGAGEGELLLVHAPTGTGKTLAYLLPALLWARRHDVRVGVATYTRALQEQAMEREVPRALALLERAGAKGGTRVATLKGRENYLCWRALERALPDEATGAEEWLAWAQLVTFALHDETGDLDRCRLAAPLRLESARRFERALFELARHVRAQSSCCTREGDRATCGAEVARRRAERSHVVLTNHSFALARQDFFRHMVFDECEHLHEQAHAAWSHAISVRALRELLGRLRRTDAGHGRGRGLLERIEARLVLGTRSYDCLEQCDAAREALARAVDELERGVQEFLDWRRKVARERSDQEAHALLREYVEAGPAAALIEARRELCAGLAALDGRLAELSELVNQLGERHFARARRTLTLVRGELTEAHDALSAWIPLEEGAPRFAPQTFHDVQVDARGEAQLVARVLLPNEYLGRHYLPRLATGVFLSATAWLREGFEAARCYLGLDRAAEPAEGEERPPARVRTFKAPEVFDYGRVLVAVPRDAPPTRDKEAFLAYVGGFLGQLGERTNGRVLGLFTNSEDLRRVGARLEGFFRARRIPFLYQGMPGTTKEQLGELFRTRPNSVLLGVDTFWYGADFPGRTLEYLVLVKLPYGVPDGYHHAQCAALGAAEQRRRIYMPRALAKFRQGFGRLMRSVEDRGCVFVLDGRILEPRHRAFLRELPVRHELLGRDEGARLVRGDTALCLDEALRFMGLEGETLERAPEPEPGGRD